MPQTAALLHELRKKSTKNIFLQGLLASSTPLFFSGLRKKAISGKETPSTFVFILSDADEAGYFYHDLQTDGVESTLFFPSGYRRAVKYGQRDAANEILRTEVMASLSQQGTHSSPLYIVTYPEALSELVVSKKLLDERLIKLSTILGGIQIDTIRTFEVESQLSHERKEEVAIVPEMAGVSEEKISFLELLPEDTVLVAKDFDYVREKIEQTYKDGFSSQSLTEQLEGKTELEQQEIRKALQRETMLVNGALFAKEMARFKHVELTSATGGDVVGTTLSFHTTPQPLFHKQIDILKDTLASYVQQGYTIYILADSPKQHQRLKEILDAPPVAEGTSGTPFIPIGVTIHEGFIDHDLKACFFTDHQIFDRFHKYNLKSDKARQGKMALTMKELQEMEPGDFIVHVDFGIGKFAGLIRVPLPNKQDGYQEMIRLVYQRGDIVDVSIHSLYKISKYRRSDSGEAPRLSTLGTGAWERMKERTKKRIKDIARDLIRLYAKRRREKGFAFSPDTFMQHELEASFLYEDTPDQAKATNDVKADMESSEPMDRLVCGDVGFGKTEVAVRAAFKAACDSKQVAVMVPTTVLAFQHYQTFRDRLSNLPVRVDYLSRARSAKKTKEILADLEAGRIDILVGTHKLIGKNVKWKDLGLLIIDEEQKFGVSTKEKLRQMKTNVDTLTMSATPIPRTLQFSLMGARDMSIMRTPPPNRYPIQTVLASFGGEVIADAIGFELSRNGQVFFVNDNIKGLDHIANVIKKYVPDARVAIGHGQMKPEQLEEIILGFINYDYDVLLSTTIVENGIDIPNANTIIINDAHRFGLSDLHQMRGRVGRSNRKAFCYLLSPPLSVLSPDARRRLEALETFSELGSGFSLAMQDLDIRGAGNLLGAEQSGFMEDLGYETYLKILKEAMAELRNEAGTEPSSLELSPARTKSTKGQLRNEAGTEPSSFELSPARTKSTEGQLRNESPSPTLPLGGGGGGLPMDGLFVSDCSLESDLEMYYPDSYVPGDSERMLLYRELDNIETDEELEAYHQRMVDRFGPVPHEGEELMHVVKLRRLGKLLGCEKIVLKQNRMQMQLVSTPDSPYYQSDAFEKIINYMMTNPRRCTLKEARGHRMAVVSEVKTVREAVDILSQI